MNQSIHKVLVIGGAGYIGSTLSRQLLDQGFEVTVLDSLLFGPEPVQELEHHQCFRLLKADLRDLAAVSSAVIGQDAVVLLGALVGEPACDRDHKETVDVNFLASKAAAEAARYYGVRRFIFASTDSCYGIQEGILTEDSPLNPISLYAVLKRDLENELLGMIGPDFSPTILRLATVYGLSPRMRFDLIINILTMHAVVHKKIKIYGGQQWRPLVHVADAARGFVDVLKAPLDQVKGEVFNIGSNQQNYQIGQLGRLVLESLPDTEVETIDQPPDLRDYHVNFDKAAEVLGYGVRYTVVDAVAEIKTAINRGAITDPMESKYRNA